MTTLFKKIETMATAATRAAFLAKHESLHEGFMRRCYTAPESVQLIPANYSGRAGHLPLLRIRRNGKMCGTVTAPRHVESPALAEIDARIVALRYALEHNARGARVSVR